MTKPAIVEPISYAGYRFPPEVISYVVWLYFRFPLSLRMVEEMLAARSIDVTYETVRQWARTFGQQAAKRIRARVSTFGDKWHLDEVVTTIKGKHHWLWRAVDQHGYVLDVLVQSRRNSQAAGDWPKPRENPVSGSARINRIVRCETWMPKFKVFREFAVQHSSTHLQKLICGLG